MSLYAHKRLYSQVKNILNLRLAKSSLYFNILKIKEKTRIKIGFDKIVCGKCRSRRELQFDISNSSLASIFISQFVFKVLKNPCDLDVKLERERSERRVRLSVRLSV